MHTSIYTFIYSITNPLNNLSIQINHSLDKKYINFSNKISLKNLILQSNIIFKQMKRVIKFHRKILSTSSLCVNNNDVGYKTARGRSLFSSLILFPSIMNDESARRYFHLIMYSEKGL